MDTTTRQKVRDSDLQNAVVHKGGCHGCRQRSIYGDRKTLL